jgi:hypothetical protein
MMTRSHLILIAVFLSLTVNLPAQKKAAPKPPKAAAKPGQKPGGAAAGVTGKEEREIAGKVPAPTAAKLPEAKYENLDISKNETRGTVTVSFSAGLYNFTSKTENPYTKTTRSYTLPFDYTTVFGMDLAFRFGKDKEKDHDTKTGFHYYRSNRGIFTDFELGLKVQRTENKPSRFNFSESGPSGSVDLPLDLGTPYSATSTGTSAQNMQRAGITPQLRQAYGNVAADVTMFYANTYYHMSPLNFIMNFGSGFRWFDASIGPSLRFWYYKDFSDPVRIATRNDDWTRATFMIVYRQYIQFHPLVRLRAHFYFPALTYFTQLAKSPRFNENEFILNTALEVVAIRIGNIGLVVSGGYEGHWWFVNPYSSDKYVRTGFAGDTTTDASYAGFEHKNRTSWELFASVGVDYHFGASEAASELGALPAAAPDLPAARPADKQPKRR